MKKILLLTCMFCSFYEAKTTANVSSLSKEVALLKKQIAQLRTQKVDTRSTESLFELDPQNDQQLLEKKGVKNEKITLKDKLHMHGHVKLIALHDLSEIGEGYNRDYSYAVQVRYKDDPNNNGAGKALYGNETRMHAKESKIAFTYNDTIRLFNKKVPIATYMDFDLYNGKEGNGLFTHSHQPRIRSAYVDVGDFRIGLAWTLFMDFENFPQALDFGNTTGESLLRQPQIRYTYHYNDKWAFAASIENPDSAYIKRDGTKTYTLTLGNAGSKLSNSAVPDVVVAMRYKNDKINTGLRGVVTHARSYEFGKKLEKYGAGIGWSGGYTFSNKDRVFAHLNFGKGMGRYLHDAADSGFFLDEVKQAMYSHKVFGCLACYKHHWKKDLVSNLNLGFTKIKLHDNILNQAVTDKRAFNFFDHLVTVHANLIWTPLDNFEVGLEYLHINKFKAKFKNIAANLKPQKNGYTDRILASIKIRF